jgi:glycosyltransferase involved in cell wall biosynthesis
MSNTFPTSDIYCLWNDAPERFSTRRVSESVLAKTPLRKSKAAALPFMPKVWGSVPLEDYDWTLVSSHLFAHHVGTTTSRKLQDIYAYVHTPARYIWSPELDKRGQSAAARLVSPYFRKLDKLRASEGTHFAANSKFVKDRIRDTWDQDAVVIYPPVAIKRLQSRQSWLTTLNSAALAQLEQLPETYILGASRFVAYKQLENVIRAGEATGIPVVLAGSGPEERFLREVARQASVPVHFVSSPSDELLYALIQGAIVFVFPPIEDFGILPVEAMALGTPVVVNAMGGAVESVAALKGGVAVELFHGTDIKKAIQEAAGKDMTKAAEYAKDFSEESFSMRIIDWMTKR